MCSVLLDKGRTRKQDSCVCLEETIHLPTQATNKKISNLEKNKGC